MGFWDRLKNTTAEYLVNGAEDDAESIKFADEERRLVMSCRQISRYGKSQLMLIVDAWNRSHKGK